MAPAERNYDIFDKELLAVIRALKEWRHLLEGSAEPVQIITDHKNLEYFSQSKHLNRRQIRWMAFLADFNFQIVYRPGSQNKKADILSRRSDLTPVKGGGEPQALLSPELFINAITSDVDIENLICEILDEDSKVSKVLESLRKGEDLEFWTLDNGLLFFRGKIYIPNDLTLRKLVIESRHDNIAAGHPGHFRTLELISRMFYWPGMKKSIVSYINTCESCIRSKPSNRLPIGLLLPTEIPHRPWEEIAYDLIVGLPDSDGFDAILTVVDRFSKMAHFIPTHSTATAIDVANLFITHIWKIHGLPKKAISDRGPNFNAKVLKQIYKRLDIKPSFSTAYHPQTDGQTERLNQVVEIYLRHYTSHRQHDWAALLPMAEFAYNNGTQASTGKTPFFICYGFHPRFSISDLEPSNIPAADDHIQFLQKGYEEVQSAITISQERMKTYYDRKHREAKDYAIGDKAPSRSLSE
ncbi:Retrotransposable element Tf2 [Ceratobasidium theobromae]|uniref:Retrotransposable element Tf2 n=1 Tax=Ceratobasidium theobromae TaxID=1582974 RepID=A0A5N5Q6Y2_9AGAM|nr:Retrotransposable element Tf2 [Ceratobasidium theobromae]